MFCFPLSFSTGFVFPCPGMTTVATERSTVKRKITLALHPPAVLFITRTCGGDRPAHVLGLGCSDGALGVVLWIRMLAVPTSIGCNVLADVLGSTPMSSCRIANCIIFARLVDARVKARVGAHRNAALRLAAPGAVLEIREVLGRYTPFAGHAQVIIANEVGLLVFPVSVAWHSEDPRGVGSRWISP